jgi:hemoglobin
MKSSFKQQIARPILAVGLAAMLLGVVNVAPAMAKPKSAPVAAAPAPASRTLYQRLGGYDAIAAVVNDFADRLVADPRLSRSFGGFSNDRLSQFKTFNIQLVCQVTGGPCTYHGRDMRTTHGGSHVTDAEFDIVAGHLVETLDKFGVKDPERTELLTIIGSLRPQIVG